MNEHANDFVDWATPAECGTCGGARDLNGDAECQECGRRFGCGCGHALADHSDEPALDGRTGCRAAVGIARCDCDEIEEKKALAAWHEAHAARVLAAAVELDNLLAGIDDDRKARTIRETLREIADEHVRKARSFFCEHANATSAAPGEWECDDCGKEFTKPEEWRLTGGDMLRASGAGDEPTVPVRVGVDLAVEGAETTICEPVHEYDEQPRLCPFGCGKLLSSDGEQIAHDAAEHGVTHEQSAESTSRLRCSVRHPSYKNQIRCEEPAGHLGDHFHSFFMRSWADKSPADDLTESLPAVDDECETCSHRIEHDHGMQYVMRGECQNCVDCAVARGDAPPSLLA